MSDKNREELRKKWGAQGTEGEPTQSDNDNAPVQSRFFAVDPHSHVVPSLKCILRNGRLFFLPYSHQPVIEHIPDEGLFLRTYQHTIHIRGRGLATLAEWLGTFRVSWIKENPSSMDDGTEGVHVSDIIISENE